eukprot:11063064-Alexandrium_andersonii.AAC.1
MACSATQQGLPVVVPAGWGACLSFSGNFGKCRMAPGVRSLNCTGPGRASRSLSEAPEGLAKRPCGRAGGAFEELLEQPTPKLRTNSEFQKLRERPILLYSHFLNIRTAVYLNGGTLSGGRGTLFEHGQQSHVLSHVRGCSRPHRGDYSPPPDPPDGRLRRAGGARRGIPGGR